MNEARSRDTLLRKIREALSNVSGENVRSPDFNAPIYHDLGEDLTMPFAENLVKSGGGFVYCENEEEFYDQLFALKAKRGWQHFYVWEKDWQRKLHAAGISFVPNTTDFIKTVEASLTTCEALVARSGSILISSGTASGRRLSIYPPVQLVVAHVAQLVTDLKDGFALAQANHDGKLPSMLSVVTGPSRTADIEKTLVRGAHGPKELILFLIDDFTG
jgi:L-lactate dehydrogenase complex protein LldG